MSKIRYTKKELDFSSLEVEQFWDCYFTLETLNLFKNPVKQCTKIVDQSLQIPQIILVGKTLSGKTHLAQISTGLPFPSGNDTKYSTRCPIEANLIRDASY